MRMCVTDRVNKLTALPQQAGKQKGACAQKRYITAKVRLNEPVADVLLQPQPQRLERGRSFLSRLRVHLQQNLL